MKKILMVFSLVLLLFASKLKAEYWHETDYAIFGFGVAALNQVAFKNDFSKNQFMSTYGYPTIFLVVISALQVQADCHNETFFYDLGLSPSVKTRPQDFNFNYFGSSVAGGLLELVTYRLFTFKF